MTDVYPETQANLWDAVNITTLSGSSNQISVYVRGGSCDTLTSQPFQTTTKSGIDFQFNDIQGDCFQYKLEFGGDWNYTDIIQSVNIDSFRYEKPAVSDLNI